MSKKNVAVVGVDDGHFGTKVVMEDGTCLSFPSRGRAGRHLISWTSDANGEGGEGLYKTVEGLDFTVNPHMQQYDDTRFSDYPRSALNRVLVHHALLGSGFGGKNVAIVTGLPVSYYYLPDGTKNSKLIAAKQENLALGVTTGSTKMPKILKNAVATEAIAAYFDQLMDMNGEETADYPMLIESVVGIIDVGGKTTDCAVVFPGGRQVDIERSGSSDVGVLALHTAVESLLRVHLELDNVPPRLVESAIKNGVVKLSGEEKDVKELVDGEKKRLAEQIMASVRTRIGTGKDLDVVLFVGGGTIVLKEQLKPFFPHARFAEEPEFANARGMYKIGKYVFQLDKSLEEGAENVE